jgi:hypothetical protein
MIPCWEIMAPTSAFVAVCPKKEDKIPIPSTSNMKLMMHAAIRMFILMAMLSFNFCVGILATTGSVSGLLAVGVY